MANGYTCYSSVCTFKKLQRAAYSMNSFALHSLQCNQQITKTHSADRWHYKELEKNMNVQLQLHYLHRNVWIEWLQSNITSL